MAVIERLSDGSIPPSSRPKAASEERLLCARDGLQSRRHARGLGASPRERGTITRCFINPIGFGLLIAPIGCRVATSREEALTHVPWVGSLAGRPLTVELCEEMLKEVFPTGLPEDPDYVQIELEAPFALTGANGESETFGDWRDPLSFAPLLGLMGRTVSAVTISRNSALAIEFADGTRLDISSIPKYDSWSLLVLGEGELKVYSGSSGDPPMVFPAVDSPTVFS